MANQTKELKVRITFIEELLGSSPSDPKIYENFIATKAKEDEHSGKTQEEIESISNRNNMQVEGDDELVPAFDIDDAPPSITVFSRTEDGTPIIWDYQIKGFFKNAAKAYYAIGGDSKLTSFKTKIDNLVFVKERKIPLIFPDGTKMTMCQRPLRAQTAKGERIALACSEAVPAGTTAEFTVMVLKKDLMARVIEWLDYGKLNGLGQWHNSGKGRFEWRDISDHPVEVESEEEKTDDKKSKVATKEAEEQPVKKKRGRPKKEKAE